MNAISTQTNEVRTILKNFHEDVRSNDPGRLERALSLYLEKKNKEEFKKDAEFHKEAIILGMKMGKDQAAENFAVAAALECINTEPNNPKWYSELAYAYWWFQKPTSAIEMAIKALSLIESFNNITDSSKSIIMGNLAYYYAEMKQSEYGEQAKQLAREAVKINRQASTLDTLGYVLLRFNEGSNDLKEAREFLEEALASSGEGYKAEVEKHLKELKEAER
jgi:tetratricopeptide (TPR) repeat protein